MFGNLQVLIFLLLHLFVFGLTVVALVDLLRRPAPAFPRAGKRTKNFWLAIIAVATAVAFVAIPPPLGFGLAPFFIALIAAVAAIVYLVDVKPAVAPYSGRRGTGGRGSGGW